jgi:hypothetical protein
MERFHARSRARLPRAFSPRLRPTYAEFVPQTDIDASLAVGTGCYLVAQTSIWSVHARREPRATSMLTKHSGRFMPVAIQSYMLPRLGLCSPI